MTDLRSEAKGEAFTVDTNARWREIQEISYEIAYSDRVPSRVESALCGAVLRAREAMQEVERLSASSERAGDDDRDTWRAAWQRSEARIKELEAELAAVQDAREAAEREARRKEQEQLDAVQMLRTFVDRFGDLAEFRAVVAAIRACFQRQKRKSP